MVPKDATYSRGTPIALLEERSASFPLDLVLPDGRRHIVDEAVPDEQSLFARVIASLMEKHCHFINELLTQDTRVKR
jgi:hypothetical protein